MIQLPSDKFSFWKGVAEHNAEQVSMAQKKVKDVTLDPVDEKLVIAYTDGTLASLNLADIVNDIHISAASFDASTNALKLTDTDGNELVVDLSAYAKKSDVDAHTSNTNNPHGVSASQIGVEEGATANATNEQLRDRSTHTGEQAISTITGLQGKLDEKANTSSVQIWDRLIPKTTFVGYSVYRSDGDIASQNFITLETNEHKRIEVNPNSHLSIIDEVHSGTPRIRAAISEQNLQDMYNFGAVFGCEARSMQSKPINLSLGFGTAAAVNPGWNNKDMIVMLSMGHDGTNFVYRFNTGAERTVADIHQEDFVNLSLALKPESILADICLNDEVLESVDITSYEHPFYDRKLELNSGYEHDSGREAQVKFFGFTIFEDDGHFLIDAARLAQGVNQEIILEKFMRDHTITIPDTDAPVGTAIIIIAQNTGRVSIVREGNDVLIAGVNQFVHNNTKTTTVRLVKKSEAKSWSISVV